MNVKLKVLRRNKEKGYSDRIYYFFFVNFEHLFGDWNYKLKYTISHKFANPFFVQKQNMNSSIYARMHKFFSGSAGE